MSPLLLSVALVVIAAPRVLVLDLTPVGVDVETARAVDPLVLNAASDAGAEVIAESEIKRIADVEATKADLGCDTSSCLAELAGAMGAERVLFGSVTQLGSTVTVHLSLFDSRTTLVKREAISTTDVGELPALLPRRVRALLGSAEPAAPPAPAPRVRPLFVLGAAGVGLGVLVGVGSGVALALNEGTVQDPNASGVDKASAQFLGRVSIGALAGGLVVIGLGVVALVAGGE